MMLQVYGIGCAKCNMLEKTAKDAVKEIGVNTEVVKISDISKIVKAGVLAMPGFAVDGEMKSMGRVPTAEEIKKWVKAKM